MNDFKFVSEDYSIHHTQNYRLSIQINPDGFSALMKEEGKKILQIIHRQTGSLENTRKVFRSEESFIKFRELSFIYISIVINSAHCSLLPPEEPSVNPLLVCQADFPPAERDTFIIGKTKNDQVQIAYQVTEPMREFIAGFHNKPHIQHFTSRFIEYLPPALQKEAVFLHTTPGLLHFCIKDNTGIKFHNIFECSNDDEIIYHIMNTIRSMEYPTSMEVFYAGHLVKKQTPWKLLSSYLPGIKMLPNIFPFELSWDVHENYFTYLMTD